MPHVVDLHPILPPLGQDSVQINIRLACPAE